MIILEGPDGAGKTTLVAEICQTFGLEVGQRAVEDRKLLYTVTRQDTYTALGQEVTGHDTPRVWDRLYYSELVYADIVGRPCEFKLTEQKWIHGMIEHLECPVILCHPPFENVQANAAGAEQMDGVNENLKKIYWRYMHLTWPRQTMWYDYTVPEGDGMYFSHSTVLNRIAKYIKLRGARTW